MKTKLKNDDGDGSGIYFGEKPTALQKWPSTGHQRESGERPTSKKTLQRTEDEGEI